MSGICGWVRWDRGPLTESDLLPMLQAAAHRGPDGRGVWCGEGMGLAHLAHHTTPESILESQPLRHAEAELTLVADARIDNRDDLIRRLRPPGRAGGGPATDADLILAAYRKWGARCAAELVGDFAFAIWDGRERRLFAARDPLGMRNLHYRAETDRLLFGTDVRQLLAVPGVPSDVHAPAIAVFLAGGFGPPEWTPYEGVVCLPPGHSLLADSDGCRSWRHWEVDPEHRIRHRTDEAYAEDFRERFKDAVRSRLRSVRPVGLLLSGGVDSGAIAATAGWLLANEPGVSVPELRAYSFAWEELTACDERQISRPIADHFGFPTTDIPADDAWPLRGYPEVRPDPEGPFLLGHYVLLTRAFAAAAEKGSRLMLSGDRGDLVGGMGIHDLPSLLRRGHWITLIRELDALAGWSGRSLLGQIRRELIRVARESPALGRSPWRHLPLLGREAGTPSVHLPAWLTLEPPLEAAVRPHLGPSGGDPPLRGFAARERYRAIFTPLHMVGVAESERMHASVGQSFADPWSDRRLVEFVLAIPQRVLNRPGEGKRLTRMAMRGMLPDDLVGAFRKIVPTPLFDRGLRDRERKTVLSLLADSELARLGFVDGALLSEHYARFTEDPGIGADLFWRALSTEMWLRSRASAFTRSSGSGSRDPSQDVGPVTSDR